MKVSVVGLGKLGAPMAAVFAHRGHEVIGVDVNAGLADALSDGRAPVGEPGLAKLIRDNRSRISGTTDFRRAVSHSDFTFVIVPTPSEQDGGFSLRFVLPAMEAIGSVLREKTGFHLVALTSTVMPGSTGEKVLPALERSSGRRCGRDFGLCYNPEFIALGDVIRGMLRPDMVLIGQSDERSGKMLAEFRLGVCENTPAAARMSFINAELTKLAVNTFVTTKISYANMLAEVCERLPGADVDVVTSALGLDTRIGHKYLKGGMGYGGPCFPRDNLAFASLARRHGTKAILAEATDQTNRLQAPRLGQLVLSHLPPNGCVGILGLSYKAGTNVIEESQGMAVAQHLLALGVNVIVYDPMAMDEARPHLSANVTFAKSLRDCVRQAQVLVIATPWDEFKSISPGDLHDSSGKPTVVDCWGLLSRKEFASVSEYVTLGRGLEPSLVRLRSVLNSPEPTEVCLELEKG